MNDVIFLNVGNQIYFESHQVSSSSLAAEAPCLAKCTRPASSEPEFANRELEGDSA